MTINIYIMRNKEKWKFNFVDFKPYGLHSNFVKLSFCYNYKDCFFLTVFKKRDSKLEKH